MNIYIDFEANQAKEIVSIGAITENCKTFYALVKPHCRLGSHIKKLTGMKQKDVEGAPHISQEMARFTDWLYSMKLSWDLINFIVYGDGDSIFIDNTIKYLDESYSETITQLRKLQSRLVRVDEKFAAKFGHKIGLRSVYLTLNKEAKNTVWNHNPLEDSMMLKYICEHFIEIPENAKPVIPPKIEGDYGKKGEGKKISAVDAKFQVPIHAWRYSPKKGHQEWHVPNVGAASGLVCRAKNKRKRLYIMKKILNICETGVGTIEGVHFTFDK